MVIVNKTKINQDKKNIFFYKLSERECSGIGKNVSLL